AAASIAGLRRSTDAARADPERRRSVPHGLIRPDPIRAAERLALRITPPEMLQLHECRLPSIDDRQASFFWTLAAKDNSMARMSKKSVRNVARTTSPLVLRASCNFEMLSAPGVGPGR